MLKKSIYENTPERQGRNCPLLHRCVTRKRSSSSFKHVRKHSDAYILFALGEQPVLQVGLCSSYLPLHAPKERRNADALQASLGQGHFVPRLGVYHFSLFLSFCNRYLPRIHESPSANLLCRRLPSRKCSVNNHFCTPSSMRDDHIPLYHKV
jgi:hypothetical protein